VNSARELHGKIALVTGANKGIGQATAFMLAEQGAHVLVHHRNRTTSIREATKVREKIESTGGEATLVIADLANREEIAAMFEEITVQTGRLDILVNNAAMAHWMGVADLDLAKFDYTMQVSCVAHLQCINLAIPLMKEGGRIVDVTTFVTEIPLLPGALDYVAAKSALRWVLQSMAAELAPKNILINTVSPGFVDTRAWRMVKRAFNQWYEWLQENYRKDILMQPEEVAEAICQLCSFQNFGTGQHILVDRGVTTFCKDREKELQQLIAASIEN